MSGRIIPTLKKGQRFPGIRPLPNFGILWSASELSWQWWISHLACYCITIRVKSDSRSTGSWFFCHIGSNQFMSYPQGYVILLEVMPCPLPSYFRRRTRREWSTQCSFPSSVERISRYFLKLSPNSLYFKIFIHLAVPGLSSGTWDL